MTTLSLVGLSDDGSSLILSGPEGQRHRLPVDERVRSATRASRTSAPEIELADRTIGPRDIQHRIRAGATAAEVAEFSGWEIARVEKFATAVVQERAWMAQRAQACRLGHGEEDPTLGDVVSSKLADRGINEDDAHWDSWLMEDGVWTVLLSYPAGAGDRVATWAFDPPARSLRPTDDEAGWFTEEHLPVDQRPHLVSVETGTESDQPHPRRDGAREAQARPDGARAHPAGRVATKKKPDEPARQQPAPSAAGSDSRSWDDVLFGAPEESR